MTPAPRILIAEDTTADYNLLVHVLNEQIGPFANYRCMTTRLCCGILSGKHPEFPPDTRWDLVIYDPHLLDQRNGVGLEDVVRCAHARGVPVLILTSAMLFDAEEFPAAADAESCWEKDEALSLKRQLFGDTVRTLVAGAA